MLSLVKQLITVNLFVHRIAPNMTVEVLNQEFASNIGQLKSYLLRITASVTDAEDIVQDTYIKAVDKLNSFRGESSLKTWLFTIASNLAKDNLKAQKRWTENVTDITKAAAIADLKKQGKYTEGMVITENPALHKAKEIGEMLWKNGLPVLDDLHNSSYDWNMPDVDNRTDTEIQKWYTDHYIESIGRLSPGLTMVIMHCTNPSANFKNICNEGNKRKGDLLAMIDPRLKEFLQKNGFILTTWREVMERRIKAGNTE